MCAEPSGCHCDTHGKHRVWAYTPKWRAKFGGMRASLMARRKEVEEENRRLKKMYIEKKIKAEIVAEALAKSDEAISPT
jgi:putative transposase